MIKERKIIIMKNKFNLTREENKFIAKRNIVDYIWKSANLEGIGGTGITKINYIRTQAQWNAITKGANAFLRRNHKL